MKLFSCLKKVLISILIIYLVVLMVIILYFLANYYSLSQKKLNVNEQQHLPQSSVQSANYVKKQKLNQGQNSINNKFNLNLSDILITIKTSSKNHNTRLRNIIHTWYQFAHSQVYAVTDIFDGETNKLLNGKLIGTTCSPGHDQGLCCKFGTELGLFFNIARRFKWLCHVDDDNYVNVPNLVQLLSKYDHRVPYFFGKSSWNVPVERKEPKKFLPQGFARFWFGSFGAGVCLSSATMYKIKKHASAKAYLEGCNKMGLPDDTYLGFLLEWEHKINFTNITTMHHHLEVDEFRNLEYLSEQVTLSFGQTYFPYFDKKCNCTRRLTIVPQVKNLYDEKEDPLLMKTVHCLLFPETNQCKQLIINALEKMENLRR